MNMLREGVWPRVIAIRRIWLGGMIAVFLAAGLMSLTLLPRAVLKAQGRGALDPDPLLRDLVGVDQPIEASYAQQLGIGWVRIDVSGYAMSPKPGQINWEQTDRQIQQANAEGLKVLASLAYTPGWAETVKSLGKSPPTDPHVWTNFVEQGVSRYCAPPYNVRYFQIWNEPTQDAFFKGTNQQYVDVIYLPAAQIIRQHGCKVVFGGWTAAHSVQELDSVLNYRDAWKWTDIVDLHYHPMPDLQYVYSKWVAQGPCEGMWQSEFGGIARPGALSNYYSHFLYWTLQTGWRNPEEFKLFWYAASAYGADGDRHLIRRDPGGEHLSDPGQHLLALNQALGQGPLSAFTQFSTSPPVPTGALDGQALGYRVGSGRVVINLLLPRGFVQSHPSISISAMTEEPRSVRLTTALGKNLDLPSPRYGGGRVQVTVPLHNGFDDCPGCASVQGYLVLDQ